MKITKRHAREVLKVVDAGLAVGLGQREPGKMCVEAAVCYALGLSHRDDPECVASSLNKLKIELNDVDWSTNEARAKGMRKLAILQLGTAGVFDDVAFVQKIIPLAAEMATRAHAAYASRAASRAASRTTRAAVVTAAAYAAVAYDAADAAAAAAADAAAAYASRAHAAASRAASRTTRAAVATAASAASASAAAYAAAADPTAYATAYAAADSELIYFADKVADILIEMKVPAVKWLDIL